MNTLREAAQQALEALEYAGECLPPSINKRIAETVITLRAAMAEQPAEQEPVAWFYEERGRQWVTDDLLDAQHSNDGVITPLYTAPQPRKRLTDQEIDKAWRSVDYTVPYDQFRVDVVRAIEAAIWSKT
jgi:hypothetical protein